MLNTLTPPSSPGLDVGRRWMRAVGRRDADALAALADPAVTLHPDRLLGSRRSYTGHAGLRQWMADLAGLPYPLSERVVDVQTTERGEVAVLGELLVHDNVVSAFALVLSVREGRVIRARGYLSDQATLQQVGLLPG